MKRLCLFLSLLVLFGFGNENTHAYLRGTVAHVLSDSAENIQQLVKVRLDKPRAKEFVLIDAPEIPLKTGQRILLRKITGDTNYGIDSSFEENFEFLDFARDGSTLLLLLIWLPGLFLINKKTWLHAAAILLNLFLLIFILPLAMHGQLFWFILFFYILNSLLVYFLLPSKKILPAILAALTGSSASGLIYALLIRSFQLDPLQHLAQIIGLAYFNFSVYTDVYILMIMSFYLCVFDTVFLLKVSFRRSFYTNIRLFFFQNILLFMFLAAGLLLPFILYFRLNNLGLLYLFNYPPFVYILVKLLLCLLAMQLSCLTYFIYYYSKNRPSFDKHNTLSEIQNAPTDKVLSLHKVLEQHQKTEKPKKKRRR